MRYFGLALSAALALVGLSCSGGRPVEPAEDGSSIVDDEKVVSEWIASEDAFACTFEVLEFPLGDAFVLTTGRFAFIAPEIVSVCATSVEEDSILEESTVSYYKRGERVVIPHPELTWMEVSSTEFLDRVESSEHFLVLKSASKKLLFALDDLYTDTGRYVSVASTVFYFDPRRLVSPATTFELSTFREVSATDTTAKRTYRLQVPRGATQKLGDSPPILDAAVLVTLGRGKLIKAVQLLMHSMLCPEKEPSAPGYWDFSLHMTDLRKPNEQEIPPEVMKLLDSE